MIEAGTFDYDLWMQFRFDCSGTRFDIRSLCEMSSACVLSEGPYDRNLAFHSLRFSAMEMANALQSVAVNQYIPCEVIDNANDEWRSVGIIGD